MVSSLHVWSDSRSARQRPYYLFRTFKGVSKSRGWSSVRGGVEVWREREELAGCHHERQEDGAGEEPWSPAGGGVSTDLEVKGRI